MRPKTIISTALAVVVALTMTACSSDGRAAEDAIADESAGIHARLDAIDSQLQALSAAGSSGTGDGSDIGARLASIENHLSGLDGTPDMPDYGDDFAEVGDRLAALQQAVEGIADYSDDLAALQQAVEGGDDFAEVGDRLAALQQAVDAIKIPLPAPSLDVEMLASPWIGFTRNPAGGEGSGVRAVSGDLELMLSCVTYDDGTYLELQVNTVHDDTPAPIWEWRMGTAQGIGARLTNVTQDPGLLAALTDPRTPVLALAARSEDGGPLGAGRFLIDQQPYSLITGCQ